jgi:hypothetical protein
MDKIVYREKVIENVKEKNKLSEIETVNTGRKQISTSLKRNSIDKISIF